MLSVRQEFLTVLRESTYYLREEVAYCRLNFSGDASPTEKAFVERARIVAEELNALSLTVADDQPGNDSLLAIWNLGRAQLALTRLPKPLFEISQSSSNRRALMGSSQGGRALRPMRLVHPYYSSSYLSIECFVRYFHELCDPIYPVTYRPEMPLVDIWTSEEYAWDPAIHAPSNEIIPTKELMSNDDFDKEGFHDGIRDALNLTTLRVPRWACQQLRKVGGILPHELCHRLFGVNNLFAWRDFQWLSEKNVDQDHFRKALDKIYGENIAKLLELHANLVGALTRNVYQLLPPRLADLGNLEPYVSAAAEELLCDAFAFYVAGDAYVYAIATEFFPQLMQSYAPLQKVMDDRRDDPSKCDDKLAELYLEMHQTPPPVRLIALVSIASTVQSEPLMRRLKGYLDASPSTIVWRDLYPNLSEDTLKLLDCYDFLKEFSSFVQSKEFKATITELFDTLGVVGIVNFGGDYGTKTQSWERIQQRRSELLSQLTDGQLWDHDLLFGGEYNPVDLLGAIWESKIRLGETVADGLFGSGNQTVWRLFLEQYLSKEELN
jgi:hypothetical protein